MTESQHTPLENPAPPAAVRAPIRLVSQVLTCLVFCLIAAPIIYFSRPEPLTLFSRPAGPLTQLLVGQVLALIAGAGSWLMFKLTASSASSGRTIESYARLDLRGLNPLWISFAAAIGEEMLFRAALQPLLGVWVVSLLFLLTHVPAYRFRKLDGATIAQAAGVFGGSVVLGFVFEYVGLLAAMLVHAWIDIVGLLIVRRAIQTRKG
ncbi:CPBP family intramembrane glutamic endopeptidase [Massilia norwichensis]|uniref:CPBP family intramembrane metalloprotease n=1 Tax=Massilia norwichensis TaxID=1442366 RepID=A0ABT2A335_9BURK|nr:CPBP family intramembrane glutamic endopeptidase [Massilia norwichensis]MCS0588589.1 CPBP family intramembrane metalloprotease [Massilia norwichensis]